MGSGKTTLGKKLAKLLKLEFVDLDQVIVDRINMSIPDYFKLHGEEQFRKLEQEVLHEQAGQIAVISTGGGSPCFYDNMDWILQNGLSIYLVLSPKALHSRLEQSNIETRPALNGLRGEALLNFIQEKLSEREPFYKKADIHIDQLNTSLETRRQSIENHEKNTLS